LKAFVDAVVRTTGSPLMRAKKAAPTARFAAAIAQSAAAFWAFHPLKAFFTRTPGRSTSEKRLKSNLSFGFMPEMVFGHEMKMIGTSAAAS
jgi:hypothetical protein